MAGMDGFFPPKDGIPPKGPSSIGCVPLKKRFLWPYKHPLSSQSSEDNSTSESSKPAEDTAGKGWDGVGGEPTSQPTATIISSSSASNVSSAPAAVSFRGREAIANPSSLLPQENAVLTSHRQPEPIATATSSSSSSADAMCITNTVVSTCCGTTGSFMPPSLAMGPLTSTAGSSGENTSSASATQMPCASVEPNLLPSSAASVSETGEQGASDMLQRSMPLKYAIKRRLPSTTDTRNYWTDSVPSVNIIMNSASSSAVSMANNLSEPTDNLVKSADNHAVLKTVPSTNQQCGSQGPMLKVCRKKKIYNSTPMVNVNLPPRYLPIVRHMPSPRHVASTGYLIGTKYVPGGGMVVKRKRTAQWMPQKLKPPVRHSARLRNKKAAKNFLAKFAPSPGKESSTSTATAVAAAAAAAVASGSTDSPAAKPKLEESAKATTTQDKSVPSVTEKLPLLPAEKLVEKPFPTSVATDNSSSSCSLKSKTSNATATIPPCKPTDTMSVPATVTTSTSASVATANESLPATDSVCSPAAVAELPVSEEAAAGEVKSSSTAPSASSLPQPLPKVVVSSSQSSGSTPSVSEKSAAAAAATELDKAPGDSGDTTSDRPPLKITVVKPKKSKKSKHKRSSSKKALADASGKSKANNAESETKETVKTETSAACTTALTVDVSEPEEAPKKKGPRVVLYANRNSGSGSSQWKCALETSPLLKGCKDCKVVLDKLPDKLTGGIATRLDFDKPNSEPCEEEPKPVSETGVIGSPNLGSDIDSDDPDKLVIDMDSVHSSSGKKKASNQNEAPKRSHHHHQSEPESLPVDKDSSAGAENTDHDKLKSSSAKGKRGRPRKKQPKKRKAPKCSSELDDPATNSTFHDSEHTHEQLDNLKFESSVQGEGNIADDEAESKLDDLAKGRETTESRHQASDSDKSQMVLPHTHRKSLESKMLCVSPKTEQDISLSNSQSKPCTGNSAGVDNDISEEVIPSKTPVNDVSDKVQSDTATSPGRSGPSGKRPGRRKSKTSAKSKRSKSRSGKSSKTDAVKKDSKEIPPLPEPIVANNTYSCHCIPRSELCRQHKCGDSPPAVSMTEDKDAPSPASPKPRTQSGVPPCTRVMEADADNSLNLLQEEFRDMKQGETRVIVITKKQYDAVKEASTTGSKVKPTKGLVQVTSEVISHGSSDTSSTTKAQKLQSSHDQTPVTGAARIPERPPYQTSQTEDYKEETKPKGGKFFTDYRKRSDSHSPSGVSRYIEKTISKKGHMFSDSKAKSELKNKESRKLSIGSSSSLQKDGKVSNSWKEAVMNQIKLFNQDPRPHSSDSESDTSWSQSGEQPKSIGESVVCNTDTETCHVQSVESGEPTHGLQSDMKSMASPTLPLPQCAKKSHPESPRKYSLLSPPGKSPFRQDSLHGPLVNTGGQNYANQVASWVSDISDDDNDHGPKKSVLTEEFKVPKPAENNHELKASVAGDNDKNMPLAQNTCPVDSMPQSEEIQSPPGTQSCSPACQETDFVLPREPVVKPSAKSKSKQSRKRGKEKKPVAEVVTTKLTPSHLSSSEHSEWECEIIGDSSQASRAASCTPPATGQESLTVAPAKKGRGRKKQKVSDASNLQNAANPRLVPYVDLYAFDNEKKTAVEVSPLHQAPSAKTLIQAPPKGPRGRKRGKKMKGKFRFEGKDDPTYMPGAKGKKGTLLIEDSDEDVDDDLDDDLSEYVEEGVPSKVAYNIAASQPVPAAYKPPAEEEQHLSPHVHLSSEEYAVPEDDEEQRKATEDDQEQYEVSDEAFNARLFALYRHDRFKTRSGAKLRQIVDFTNVDWMERSAGHQGSKCSSRSGSEYAEDRDPVISDSQDSTNTSHGDQKLNANQKTKASRKQISNANKSKAQSSHIKLKIKLPKPDTDGESTPRDKARLHSLPNEISPVHEREAFKSESDDDEPPHLSPIQQLDHHSHMNHYPDKYAYHGNKDHAESDHSFECPKLDNVADRNLESDVEVSQPKHQEKEKFGSYGQENYSMLANLQSRFEDISSASEDNENMDDVSEIPFRGTDYERNLKELYERSKKCKRKPAVNSKSSRKRRRVKHENAELSNSPRNVSLWRTSGKTISNTAGSSDEEVDGIPQLQSPCSSDESNVEGYYSTENMAFHRVEDSSAFNSENSQSYKHGNSSSDSDSSVETGGHSTPSYEQNGQGNSQDDDPLEEPHLLESDLEGLIREAVTLSRDLEEKIIQDPRSMVTDLDRLMQGTRTLYADIEEQKQKETEQETVYVPRAPLVPIGLQPDWEEDDYGGLSPAQPLCVAGQPNNVIFKTPTTVPSEALKPGKRSRRRHSSKSGSRSPRGTSPGHSGVRDSIMCLPEDNAMDKLLSQPSSRNFGSSPPQNLFADSLYEDGCNMENSIDDILLGSAGMGLHRPYRYETVEFATLGKYGEHTNEESSMWSNVDATVDLTW